jgi:hypothetical protein
VKALTLLTAAVVVAAVLVANLGYAEQVFGFLRYIPGRDVTGHFGLFALLSFGLNSWLATSGRQAGRAAATGVLGALITLEELSQAIIPARTFSLVDLSASLVGVLAGAAASSWLLRPGCGKGAP